MKKNKLWFTVGIVFLLSLQGVNVAMSAPQDVSSGRHYFEHCNPAQMLKLSKGMAQGEARRLAKGAEFPAVEIFKFAIDKKSSSFITFANWVPGQNVPIDFFCSDQLVLMVAYDAQSKIKQIAQISKGVPPQALAAASQKGDSLKKSN